MAANNLERKLDPDKLESIAKDYRAGIKSNRQIAEEKGVSESYIRKLAKDFGWKKDLTNQIRARAAELVRSQQLREEVRTKHNSQKISEEIVEENAQVQADVITAHRKDIKRARDIAQMLFEELQVAVINSDDIERFAEIRATVGSAEDGSEELNQKLLEFYTKIMELPTKAGVIDKLANTLNKLIMLERLTFGISDGDNSSDIPDLTEDELDRKIEELTQALNDRK
jgi:transposase